MRGSTSLPPTESSDSRIKDKTCRCSSTGCSGPCVLNRLSPMQRFILEGLRTQPWNGYSLTCLDRTSPTKSVTKVVRSQSLWAHRNSPDQEVSHQEMEWAGEHRTVITTRPTAQLNDDRPSQAQHLPGAITHDLKYIGHIFAEDACVKIKTKISPRAE
jgi:hypothetical protein